LRVLLFYFVFLSQYSFCQSKDEIIQQSIEFIAERFEEESMDLTSIVEDLNYYFEHPLNLNHASLDQLQGLLLLSDIQSNALLLHREMFGKFVSIYELQSLNYWTINTIRRVLPFVRIDDKLDQLHLGLKEALKNGRYEVYLRYQTSIESKAGYTVVDDSALLAGNSYYQGNKDRYYSRLRFSYRTNLSIGITAEKDPGEQFFRGAQKYGFDFYSAHAFYKGGKYLKSFVIGDYQVQIGQGLHFWSGYSLGKSADVLTVKKSARPLRPYTSVDESNFMRGGAIEMGMRGFSLLFFGSYKGIGGSVVTSLNDETQQIFTSLKRDGLHRTNSEIARKKVVHETIFGSNLRYRKRDFQCGIAVTSQGYSCDFFKDTLAYNQFDFRGKSVIGLSSDYSYILRNFHFFGEVSMTSFSKSYAMLHGVLFSMDDRAAMAIVHRNFNRGYQTMYGDGFSEGRNVQNERGLYSGVKINFTEKIALNSYFDVFRFPWLKYLVDGPSSGSEMMFQCSYKPKKSIGIYVRYREQLREKNSTVLANGIIDLVSVFQRNYRFNFRFEISNKIHLKSRIEYLTIHKKNAPTESGMLIVQDILYRPKSSPINLALRYALFDTESYNSRIYSFENNALYVFSVPANYYQGSIAYVLFRLKFLRRFDLWIKYGVRIFSNRQSLGTGPEKIDGNRKTDLTVQLRMKF
jgi:hypothetical protein